MQSCFESEDFRNKKKLIICKSQHLGETGKAQTKRNKLYKSSFPKYKLKWKKTIQTNYFQQRKQINYSQIQIKDKYQ